VEAKYLKQALHFVIQVYKAYNVTLSLWKKFLVF
jgi:hypothetical protein